jgi:septum formation protein
MRFILASASPARLRLLQAVGIAPQVRPSQFDESQVQAADPDALVRTLALCKAQAVATQLDRSDYPAVVLGCDSVLALNGEIHGKPADAQEAIARWRQMRGQVGYLYTGHALIWLTNPVKTLVQRQVTEVHFAQPSDRQIQAYVATGEPLHCAGCFALEGKGGIFVEKLVGCHTNVIGLSLPLLRAMLEEIGLDITQFWQ